MLYSMPTPLVYLAGPIGGLVRGDTVNWREYAKQRLAPEITTISPMRGTDHLPVNEVVPHIQASPPANATPRAIMQEDYFDVCRASALLVNFRGAREVSRGTLYELAWAWQRRTPTIAVIEDADNPHDGHTMVMESWTYRVLTLDEGIAIARRLLIPA